MSERINPATEEPLEPVPGDDEAAVDAALDRAAAAFPGWADTRLEKRRRLLENAADVLRETVEEYAGRMTREMCKPTSGARAEVRKCAWVCDHYAEQGIKEFVNEKTVWVRDTENQP